MKKYYSLRSYFWYLKQFRFRMITIFLSFAIADAFLAVIPIFIGRLVGVLSVSPVDTQMVWVNVGILVACSALHGLVWHSSEFLYMKYINPLTYRYEIELFRHVIAKPYPFFVGKFTGKIASYIISLGSELHTFVDTVMYNYSQELVKIFAISFILFSVNSATGAVFIGGVLMMFLVGRRTIKNSIKFEAELTDAGSTKNGKFIDIMSNFVNVKSFRKEYSEYKVVAREQELVISAATSSFKWGLFFWASMSFFVRMVIWPATIMFNVYFYLQGTISLTELVTLLSTILLFSNNVWGAVWQISQINLKLARMEEAHRYLFGKKVVHALRNPEIFDASKDTVLNKKLELKNVSFAYPDQPKQIVLDKISLEIKKGEKIGIVGKSGSGKTTLVKLLLGYYPIEKGIVLLDESPVGAEELLNMISYVPQDTTLFNRTIKENIAYAAKKTNVTNEEILKISEEALVDEFVQKIPGRYEAVVGERGVKLSTGQRQRIAIARAMMQDRPLLILDEATSALDSENEALVQKSLENLWKERTVISIAHRLSTLKKMDRIVVFENGRVIEQGTISQLLAKQGVFNELWNHQVNGMIIE